MEEDGTFRQFLAVRSTCTHVFFLLPLTSWTVLGPREFWMCSCAYLGQPEIRSLELTNHVVGSSPIKNHQQNISLLRLRHIRWMAIMVDTLADTNLSYPPRALLRRHDRECGAILSPRLLAPVVSSSWDQPNGCGTWTRETKPKRGNPDRPMMFLMPHILTPWG